MDTMQEINRTDVKAPTTSKRTRGGVLFAAVARVAHGRYRPYCDTSRTWIGRECSTAEEAAIQAQVAAERMGRQLDLDRRPHTMPANIIG